MASDWKILVSHAADDVNEATNSSVELATTGWSGSSSNTVALSTEQQYRGAKSLKVTQVNGIVGMVQYDTHTFLNSSTTYYLSLYLYVPSDWDGGNLSLAVTSLTGSSTTVVERYTQGTSPTATWLRLKTTLVLASDVIGGIHVAMTSAPTAGRYIYIDALSISTNDGLYFDGDDFMAFWRGNRHASASQMDYRNRKHGKLLDLHDGTNTSTDYWTYLSEPSGADFAPHENNLRNRALGDGAEFAGTYIAPRPTIFPVTIDGRNSPTGYHSKKKVLEEAVKKNRAPGEQSFTLEYVGANPYVPTYLDVRLQGLNIARYGNSGQGILNLVAENPGYYEKGDKYASLTRYTSLSVSYALGWLNDGTGFSNLGNTGTGEVRKIIFAENGDFYVAGLYTNWDANADADYIVKYNRATNTWSHLFTSGANNAVYDLLFLDDGDLIMVGAFTSAGGGAHNYAIRWDGSTISDISTGFNNTVRTVAFDYQRGVLYFGGGFTLAGGVADTVRVARYDLTTGVFTAMGTGMNNNVYSLVVDPATGDVYAGGEFTTASGSTVNRLARWDYTSATWNTVGGLFAGVDGPIYSMVGDGQGNIYLGGGFTETEGGPVGSTPITLNGIAKYRMSDYGTLEALGDGVGGGNVYFVYWDKVLGKLLLSGSFTSTFNGRILADRVLLWNGSTYETLSLNFPGSVIVYAFARNPANGDYVFGFDTTGTMVVPGALNNVTNGGTDDAYPIFVFDSSADVIGAEYATLTTLANRTTGAQVNFGDVRILAGSIVTVEFSPAGAKVYRLVGQSKVDLTPGAFTRDSDISKFVLMPGLNQILVAVLDTSGTPSITCYVLWRHRHLTLSGTAA